MSTEHIKQAASILTEAKEKAIIVIGAGEMGHIGLMITSAMDKIVNRLHFLSGSDFNASSPVDFPPITEFMGEKLEFDKLPEVELDPTEHEKQAFLAKVDALTVVLLAPDVDLEAVLQNNPLPEDHLVIRAVAKRVGLDDYESAPVDVDFLADTVELLKLKEAQKQAEAEADALLNAGVGETFDHEITQEDLDANPELADDGVKVGDVIQVPVQEDAPEEQEAQKQAPKNKGGKK